MGTEHASLSILAVSCGIISAKDGHTTEGEGFNSMDNQSQLITFSLMSGEPRAWVVLTSDHRKPRVVEMREERPSFWSMSTDLMPGEYRCRYYSGDERSVHYHGPATMKGSIECGMDALISVTIPEGVNFAGC